MARTTMGAVEEYARAWAARRSGRDPERLPLRDGYAPLSWDGPLNPRHPLADSIAEARRKKAEQVRRRRGL